MFVVVRPFVCDMLRIEAPLNAVALTLGHVHPPLARERFVRTALPEAFALDALAYWLITFINRFYSFSSRRLRNDGGERRHGHFGLALTELVPIPGLSRVHRVQVKLGQSTWWRSGLVGMTFGAS
jgi:hypothetical protein